MDEAIKEFAVTFAAASLALWTAATVCGNTAAMRKELAQVVWQRDRAKRHALAMEEAVDNVRDALRMESTHYLVIADDVRDVVREHAKMLAALTAIGHVRMPHELAGDAAEAIRAATEGNRRRSAPLASPLAPVQPGAEGEG